MAIGDVLQQYAAAVTYQDSGGDKPLALQSVGPDGVRAGAYIDLAAHITQAASDLLPDSVAWELHINGFSSGTIAANDFFGVWFAESFDGTIWDGRLDATGLSDTVAPTNDPTPDMTNNMNRQIGVVCHSATLTDQIVGRGIARISSQFILPVIHNQTGGSTHASNTHKLVVKPFWSHTLQS